MNGGHLVAAVVLVLTGCLPPCMAESAALPPGFVYIAEIVPGVECDLRYSGSDNFIGGQVDGYIRNACISTEPAARALIAVQQQLQVFGLSLKIFDAYRPQRAVDHFVRWAKDLDDNKNKAGYYPDVAKLDLFEDGYVARKSGHSRGSAFDLTIVSADAELDMGSRFDFFGQQSWVAYADLTAEQRANRLLLKTLMEQAGFRSYRKEWWHFTLSNEPFPATYFDFPVQ